MKSNLNGAVDGLKAEREELAMKIQKMYGVNEKLTQHIHSIDNEKRVIEQSKERLADEYENVTAMLLRTTEELEKEKMALESSVCVHKKGYEFCAEFDMCLRCLSTISRKPWVITSHLTSRSCVRARPRWSSSSST